MKKFILGVINSRKNSKVKVHPKYVKCWGVWNANTRIAFLIPDASWCKQTACLAKEWHTVRKKGRQMAPLGESLMLSICSHTTNSCNCDFSRQGFIDGIVLSECKATTYVSFLEIFTHSVNLYCQSKLPQMYLIDVEWVHPFARKKIASENTTGHNSKS